MRRDTWAATWTLLSLMAGCAVTETGNPEFGGQMALLTDTSNPSEVSLGPGGALATIDEAWVGFGDVRLVSDPACDGVDEMRVDVPVPTPVDLAAGASVVPFDVMMAEFCRVRVPMRRATLPLPAGAPPELADAAVVLGGSRADGTPFLVVSRREREADVRTRTTPFLLDDGLSALLMAFDMATWLENVDLAGAEVIGGRVLIDEDSNTALLDVFEGNVETALRLYRDANEDGVLDPEDRSDLIAEGGP